MRRFCDEGHDGIQVARDMREALLQRPVKGVTAAVCDIARNPGQNGGQACALHATMAPEQHKKCMGKYSFSIKTMS